MLQANKDGSENTEHPSPNTVTGKTMGSITPASKCPLSDSNLLQHPCLWASDMSASSSPQGSWTPAPTSHLVVDVTICKHSVEVLDTFLSIPVIVVFQALLYCSHIHRCFNDLIVILESRESKRPVSPPQSHSTHSWACRPHRSLHRCTARSSSMVSVNNFKETPR